MLTPEDLAQIVAIVTAAKTELRERIEETETKLLTELHKWASPNEARQKTHTAALRAIDLEMEALNERVGKLEGKQPQ
jgi:hypothetical protein